MKASPASSPDHLTAGPTRMTKLMILSLLIFVSYFSYTLNFVHRHEHCTKTLPSLRESPIFPAQKISNDTADAPTSLDHVVFGIAASAKLWPRRKEYIKLWWRPDQMHGVVWLDKPVKSSGGEDDERSLPALRISAPTLQFKYRHPTGHRSAIRISRIVSETLRAGVGGARWIVMGDDDTVFVPENLIGILRKYDHEQFYYIGASSESHLQNINFSYAMAYGGGGFAITVPLARALAAMQDRCLERYPQLYGSDSRIQACMAELGVPLTKEPGFHQFDVYGSLFGLLTAHPVAPLVSLHHLDIVDPIFPHSNRVKSIQKLQTPARLDPASLMQQSICYDPTRNWTISVSWGYAAQIFRGVIPVREMEMPARTFLNWWRRADYTAFAFNTRPFFRNTCTTPFVYYMDNVRFDSEMNRTVSEYALERDAVRECKWKMADPGQIERVEVVKTIDPHMWNKAPRRNCCKVLPSGDEGTMSVAVGVCSEGEIAAV